jgi:hypothetical protein
MEKEAPLNDPNLKEVNDDPRNLNPSEQGKAQKQRGAGRNTESFDPKSTLVRPSMRIMVGPNKPSYGKSSKHDDVIIVPEFFCKEDDWTLYYKLIEEMREIQKTKEGNKAEWISWHEGAHLISKDPSASPTFQKIVEKIASYFEITMKSIGTRFNWYTSSSDWKPFHHDSAAFNPERARNQNITVGVSFGSTRELAFLSAKTGEKIYFPQTNGMLFSFGRDVNINWKHGVNALPDEKKDGKGRISIILWGLTQNVIEEEDSPPMLTDNTRGNGYSMHKTEGDYHARHNRRKKHYDYNKRSRSRDKHRHHDKHHNYERYDNKSYRDRKKDYDRRF